jgi:hypothetical protein
MDNEQTIDTQELSRELVVEILRYLVAHPKAKDTASGIEKWWLPASGRKAGSVQESLKVLVAKGWGIERSSFTERTTKRRKLRTAFRPRWGRAGLRLEDRHRGDW